MDFKQQLREAYDKDAKRRDDAGGKRDQWKLDIRQRFITILRKEGKKSILESGSGAGLDAKFFQDHSDENNYNHTLMALNDIINSIPSDQDFSIAERLVAIVAFLSL